MKCYILHIGVIDHKARVHFVPFYPGVNVITGKSSTGKSALIEIFDYCFGSSDFTVPQGIITQNSQLYFVIASLSETNLILARKGNSNKVYIKEVGQDVSQLNPEQFTMSQFESNYFLPLNDFKKELGRYFGIVLDDIDESIETRQFKGNRKSPTPSIRSLTSFLLQHQNLVANKHAIFYRFDEKEKREQVIDHFKVFAGFVDQEYFVVSQKYNTCKDDIRRLEQRIARRAEEKGQIANKIDLAFKEYVAITGIRMTECTAKDMLINPAHWLVALRNIDIFTDSNSDEYLKQKESLEQDRSQVIGELRRRKNKLSAIQSSIKFAKSYVEEVLSVNVPTESVVRVSECPFCHQTHNHIEMEANKLEGAISWLNKELCRSPYLRESFESDGKKLTEEIELYKCRLSEIEGQIDRLDKQVTDLENRRTIIDLAKILKLRVEGFLEDVLDYKSDDLDSKLASLKNESGELKKLLDNKYAVGSQIRNGEAYINSAMATIGSNFYFEESYRPINLKFSLHTFDLWHETNNGKDKVFLRSMGSGANWLYCHITLFMSLHKYFCSLGDKCKIPSFIFLDQPSQVYFPSVVDTSTAFDPKKIAQDVGRSNSLDDDICAVENLYSQLVVFCNETLKETGIEPQIIITDHADNLKLADGINFESLVKGRRWRTRGFIDPL
jgi:DNA repair ATPase RecN